MIEFGGSGAVLVFGGPYSNLSAVRALEAEARRLRIAPDRIICTGDVVAYCAEPDETVNAIRQWGCHVIQGNCEQQISVGADNCACNFEEGSACDVLAKGWYPYALSSVSESSRSWMGSLPDTLHFAMAGLRFRVVHGGVEDTSRWVFESEEAVVSRECALAGDDVDVIVAGHSGLPFIVQSGHQTWFNAGVIGMPANDGTTDVWYGLLTPQRDGVEASVHRLAYDFRSASAAMRRQGYANGYARTLVSGMWPSLDILPDEQRARAGQRIRPRSVRIKSPISALSI